MKLLKPGKIGTMVLKNRVFMCPMGTSTEADGSFSDRDIRYLTERAKGGTGLIITGGTQAWTGIEGRVCNAFGTARFLEQLNVLARRTHAFGSKLCLQLVPGVGRVNPGWASDDGEVYSASETEAYWHPGRKCKAIEAEKIRILVKKMGEAAAIAKTQGVDCIELHAYGGYLTDQFMSAVWNKRTDEYGGDLNGRMKLPLDIIAEIRKTCGENFPLIVKFTPYHGIEGGRELDEGIEIAKMFEKAGVDALHIDVGCYELWNKVIPSVYDEAPTHIHIAEEIKKHVNIPIMAHGKLNDPSMAESVLQNGKTDFVGLAHQSIADPQWVNKVRRNQTYDIVPCIGCNECLKAYFGGQNCQCSVNPKAFDESYVEDKPAAEKLKVLVIGGGPGGMNAAIRAAERGFYVELWEKSNILGGNLLAAGGPSFKKDVANYIQYLVGKVYRSNITLKTMKEADPQSVIHGGFDKVILATGSSPLIPSIPGINESAAITEATDILTGKAKFGKKVVVIGGGLVGCEVAAHCAEKADSVTIIEMLDDILKTADHCTNNDIALRTMVSDRNIQTIVGARVNSISDGRIEYKQDDTNKTIEADTIIIAAGFCSNNQLYEEIAEYVDTDIIGDAIHSDKIITAVQQGYHIINNL